MCAHTGVTPDSNRGRVKTVGVGILAKQLPHYTLLLPNPKARHRSTGERIVWKYQLHYWQNQYYLHARPRVRAILKALKLRK